jgi:predicted DCC family thiol-disulfide oxidoreductase YuxK
MDDFTHVQNNLYSYLTKSMKVYFNNSCKICRAEINLYKKENIKEIDWIDITNNLTAEKETLKNNKDLLRRLHVKEGEKIIEGAEAFLFVWKRIPKYKFLYKFFKLPIIFTLFKYGYEIIAFFLYLKNKHQLKS